jgi:membrane peptidoglycan carboxypeptidase
LVDDGAVPGLPTGVDGHLAAQRKRVKATAGSRADTADDSNKFKAFLHKVGGRGPWWTQTLRWIVTLSVAGIVGVALLFFILYKTIDIPTANAAFKTQTTNVYYSDGKHKLGSFSKQDRESVPLDEIPASMQAAVVAAEDRTFYTNRGIDIKGIIRAARSNATSGSIQSGGSTITQQYVKILYLNQERSYTRKLKEAILSIKIHNQQSKKQILAGYLNTIYFGNRSYGVEVAAQTYFNKPAADLNYAQSALLATIINSPSYYDPYAEGAAARIQPRLNYVLDGMAKSGAITQAQALKFQHKLPKVVKQRNINRFSGSKGYLLQLVQEQMESKTGRGLSFDPEVVEGGGLKIVTTFNYKKQMEAIAAIKAHRPSGAKELHQSLVSVKPGSGAVEAMYAGRDYLKNQINWATSGTQPGSSFKAFAVVAALENGYSLKTKLNGSSPLVINGKQVTENEGDSGGESFGSVSLARATEKSINTAFADLMYQMKDGPTKTLDAAEAAGIPARVTDPIKKQADGPPLVTPLGYFPVPPIDMANAYATLAAGGKRADWFIIDKVTQGDKTLHKHKITTKQTIPKDVVDDTVAAMQGVVATGTGTKARTICPTAGKTGTATAGPKDDQHVSSSWFVGYTPKVATAVMYNRGKLGNGDLEGYLLPTFFGGYIPAMTFQTYMNSALAGTDCGTFPPPANIKSKKGTTYKPPAPKCGSNQILNDARTKCVTKPPPTCKSSEQLNSSKTACVPKPVTCKSPQTRDPKTNKCVDPTPPAPDPQSSALACHEAGGQWDRANTPPCTLPDGTGGWVFMLPFAGLVGLRRREDELEEG